MDRDSKFYLTTMKSFICRFLHVRQKSAKEVALFGLVGSYVLTIFDIRLSGWGTYITCAWLVTGHQVQKKVEVLSPDTFGQEKKKQM